MVNPPFTRSGVIGAFDVGLPVCAAGVAHCHPQTHEPMTHTHLHFPDAHHSHRH